MSADTATGPNHSLFVQVLAQIEREPQRWNQSHCGDNSLDDLYRISADILGLDEQVLREKVAAEVACGSVQP